MKSHQKVLITLSVFLFAGCSSTGITTIPTGGMTSLPTPIPTKLLSIQLPTATDIIPIPTVSQTATHVIQPTLAIEGMKGVPILSEEDITPYIDTYEQVTGNEAILVLKVFHDVKG